MFPFNNNSNHEEIEERLYDAIQVAGCEFPLSIEELQAAERRYDAIQVDLPDSVCSPSSLLARIDASEAECENSVERSPLLATVVVALRKKQGLSQVALAQKAGIDIDELQQIESQAGYFPKPRTVSALASFFRVVPKKLASLANLTQKADDGVFDGAVRFAACSSTGIDKQTAEQKQALNELLKLLTKK